MSTDQPNKSLPLYILEILKKYSDYEHRLTQKDIDRHLRKDYDIEADRKTLSRNIKNLIYMAEDLNYEISYPEKTRITKDGDKETICTDLWYDHDFNKSELRLLIDSLLFSKQIPSKQGSDLIIKLKKLSSKYFEPKVRYITNKNSESIGNGELFSTIDLLDESIANKMQVKIQYSDFYVDKKRHPKMNKDGSIIEQIVNPYHMVANNGRYYLICNYDQHDNISSIRVDRILKPKLLDTSAKPLKKDFNLSSYMAEHIYMFSGNSTKVTFRTKKHILNEIFDWFGNALAFSNESNEEVDVTVSVNRNAFLYWALQFGLYIEVLKPEDLRKEIKYSITEIYNKYKN